MSELLDEPWCEADKAYFLRRPKKKYYFRAIHPGEWVQIAGPDAPQPANYQVRIQQIQPGFRMRYFPPHAALQPLLQNVESDAATRYLIAKVSK